MSIIVITLPWHKTHCCPGFGCWGRHAPVPTVSGCRNQALSLLVYGAGMMQ